ncbi:MAG: NAD-dependent epimerase/dehydratase family protein [Bacteroidia bacterium]|nr:NAD-dependent epimerase/dehydratase family protein [Bacteroidia bacterium]NNF32106.1 NAD-dependent epimerase/dehydratase family protein [Flavobacteriaceae bacterium]MBT8275145.1 NAD-dependent epimerase/dehydratase family protein [Bacteroidia bacterium]NNJ82244.1 NAD-dependent epimerase/dehydratase family protein [Flavobacteriaceae bacterium]NNK54970.1 NAD-dependent epimerase/dehydratase family protein [Flavobacteriaceae bacterium]
MVLVTGGTGLVGSHLLYFLLKKGIDVRAIHRKSSKLEAVRRVFSYYTKDADSLFDKIEWMEANITDIPALEDAFHGVTHVYHSAAYISFHPKHFRKLKKANIDGTANIVNLSLAHKVQKLCHVSSIATLGSTIDGSLISESTPWNPEEDNNVYAITKYGSEMEVWRGTQEGLDSVIINPGVIMGSGHWHSGSGAIVKMVAKGTKYYTEGGVSIVDVRDVVHAMIKLMDSDIINERFVLAGENITYKVLLSQLANSLGVSAPKKSISKWKLDGLRKLDWLSSKLSGSRRRLLKSTVDSMYKKSYYDGSKISKFVDFTYTNSEETLRRVGKNYLKD